MVILKDRQVDSAANQDELAEKNGKALARIHRSFSFSATYGCASNELAAGARQDVVIKFAGGSEFIDRLRRIAGVVATVNGRDVYTGQLNEPDCNKNSTATE